MTEVFGRLATPGEMLPLESVCRGAPNLHTTPTRVTNLITH